MSDNQTSNTETTTAAPAEGMAEKLQKAGEKAQKAKAERTVKLVKGATLNPAFLEKANASGAKVEEKSGFFKIAAGVKGKNLYLARKGGRVDLSGFTVTNDAVLQISEEEARAKHLGKVRGQLNFELSGTPEGDAQLLAAFDQALTELAAPLPVVEKPKREPKPKVEKPATEAAPATTEAVPATTAEAPAAS